MKFYSTHHQSPQVGLKEVLIHSLPPDGGLYMPRHIPVLPRSFFDKLPSLSLPEIALRVATPFLENELSPAAIREVVEQAVTFETPLVKLDDNLFTLELFHGPTLAFKDVGARFMARLLGKLHQRREKTIHILVATSGDTGSAVAQGFYDVPGVEVIILYPAGRISPVQEQQIATLDKNITALEVDGVFDDCQRLVKTAFNDKALLGKLLLSSANSISFGRLLPQSFYYFYAWGQARKFSGKNPVFSVPSGNFGNLTAGLMARMMGLPVARFIAAVNANATFPAYLESGVLKPAPSIATLSNAMDVGNPSNLGRIIELFDNDPEAIKRVVLSRSFSDLETRQAIREIFQRYGYQADPHGAVGYLGLRAFRGEYDTSHPAIFLETAHRAKFGEVVEEETGQEVTLPDRLRAFMGRPKTSRPVSKNYADFKQFLLEKGD